MLNLDFLTGVLCSLGWFLSLSVCFNFYKFLSILLSPICNPQLLSKIASQGLMISVVFFFQFDRRRAMMDDSDDDDI